MSNILQDLQGEIVPISQGGAAVTFPVWAHWLSDGWGVFVAVMGAIVLMMTIYSKFLEIRQRRKILREGAKK